jgi:hypothetical protein
MLKAPVTEPGWKQSRLLRTLLHPHRGFMHHSDLPTKQRVVQRECVYVLILRFDMKITGLSSNYLLSPEHSDKRRYRRQTRSQH